MIKQKLNGFAKWIVIGLAVLTIAYNTIVTQTVLKNDVHHQGLYIEKLEVKIDRFGEKVDKLIEYLMKE